ncbi:alkaline phosphatase [Qipengyuania sp. CAU 1752]
MRMRPFHLSALSAFAVSLAGCGDAYAQTSVRSASSGAVQASAQAENRKAKNVILFIGDGMGVSTVTAMRIYAGQKRGMSGEEYVLPFEKFDNVALVKTYNVDAQVPDSAGTATAMHSGQKTNIGYLGIGPGAARADCEDGKKHHLPLLGEEAKKRGLAVGIVSTARITHATPASVYARTTERGWETDAWIEESQRGLGCRDIARQLIDFDFDVALGGGLAPFYGSAVGGARLNPADDLPTEWVKRTGGSFVVDTASLAAAPMNRPVLGLFSPSHMGWVAERAPDSKEPTLTQMTQAAVQRLARDRDGYYLMVESGKIDHGHHAGRAGLALEEAVEFANAIQWAVDNTDPRETLILVTADHSHVFTIAGYPRRGNDILGLVIPPQGAGEEVAQASLATDGKPYTTLGYANGPGAIVAERETPDTGVGATQQAAIALDSETHSGEDVALYANGPGSEKARGVIEQDVIYDIITNAYGW